MCMLPSIDIPIFKGDPLDYKLFIGAFQHAVEDRTDNDRDRLYFMEQYTTGKPKEHWPSIRPEDGEALHSFSLFLSECCNAMSDISCME